MVQTPFIQRTQMLSSNASYYVDVDSTGALKTTATVSNASVSVTNLFANNNTLTYDTSNNLTQVVQTIGANTKTTSMAYDASNNLTNAAVVII